MDQIEKLTEEAVEQYKNRIMRICLECPHFPGNCPPRRCPVHTRVTLPECSTRHTIFKMVQAHTRVL